MKKSKQRLFASFLIITILLFSALFMNSCEISVGNGMSAYEIAVKNGFSGTEQEWLDSLKALPDTGEDSSSDSSENTSGDQSENVGSSSDATYNYDITINSSGVDSVKYAASLGLRSAVSIKCSFTTTVGSSYSQSTQTYTSAGAGVIYKINDEGSAFIITNYHVVYDQKCNTTNKISNSIKVFLYGMETDQYAIHAEYVGGSQNYDIAVLHISNSQVLMDAYNNGCARAADFADSDKVAVGQTAIAIGNPESEGISVTSGIVSIDSEYIVMTSIDETDEVTFRVMRVDTPINSGNSGGGLFDSEGKLIGIVNAKSSETGIENIGFAIPSNLALAVTRNIIDFCYQKTCQSVMKASIGITVGICSFETDYNEETGIIEKSETVFVKSISPLSSTYSSLSKNDIITSVKIGDGAEIKVTRKYHFEDALLDAREGDIIEIKYMRNSSEGTVKITVTQSMISAY